MEGGVKEEEGRGRRKGEERGNSHDPLPILISNQEVDYWNECEDGNRKVHDIEKPS
jgi:hypothetical protein